MSDSESARESDFEEEKVDDMDVDVPEFETSETENELKAARANALKKIQEEGMQNGEGDGNDASRQLAYLMSQSEVFAHFLTDGDGDAAGTEKKKSQGRKSGGLGGGVGRTRMSEEAEDRRLMKLAQSKGTDIYRVSEQPQSITGGTMRSYQVEGLNWMMKLHDNSINGILADEMGLGKTLQTISLLAYLNEARKHPGPHLVIVPKSTVGNWMREFAKWCPTLRAVKLLGSKEERAHVINTELKPFYQYQPPTPSKPSSSSRTSALKQAKETAESIPFNVLVTSYESCMREKSSILKMRWKFLVIDEAHRIKNEKSSLAQITRLFKVDHRLLVTGTPLQNNLHELWALLNFLMPEVFFSSSIFDSWFNTDDKEGKENVIKKLHTVLKPFMIRRVKVDVEKDLPPKKEIKLYIGLSAMQKEWYRRVLTKDVAALNALGGPDKTRLLNVLMQLRKVCNHPYLFEGAEYGPPFIDGPHIWENCGKMILLDKLLTRLLATGSRVLIFSQMTRMLDILEDYVRYKRYEYCRIDGNTTGELREDMMDAFQAEGSTKFVFLLSTRAGGLGINLTSADTVVLYDSDFNPQMDLQAMDRAHRIGQKKEVRVFRFITEGTVEEKIIERADRKLFLDAAVIQQGRLTEQLSNNMNKSELMRMVKFGADAILSNSGGDFTDEDIETLLTRGEERTEEIKSKLQTEVQHTLANFSVQMEDSSKSMNLFEFAGENFEGEDKDEGKMSLGLQLGTRERRRSHYDTVNYAEDVDLDGRPKESSSGVRKLNKKNAFILADYQFFDRHRLDEIFTLEAELSAARGEQVKAIKKLRHDDEIETRRLERVARGWNVNRTKKLGLTDRGKAEREAVQVKEEDKTKVEEMEVDEEQGEGSNSANASPSASAPVVKSAMALEADRLEAELGSESFPHIGNLAGEIQFFHTRAVQRLELEEGVGVGVGSEEKNAEKKWGDDIVSGKFNIPPEMQREKERLILEGFPRWTKPHLRAFVSGMERYGRDNLTKVTMFMKQELARNEVIPESEVRRYAEVFWRRHGELAESQSYLRKIEKGDKRAARLLTTRQSIDERIARYFEDLGQPLDVGEDGLIDVSGISLDDSLLKMAYGTAGKGKVFSEEADRCILLTVYTHGYGDCSQDWEEIRRAVTRRPEFRFDFVLKSRSAIEVQRRSDFLIRIMEKDNVKAVEKKKLALELRQKEERARKRALKKEEKMAKERQEQELLGLTKDDNGNPVGLGGSDALNGSVVPPSISSAVKSAPGQSAAAVASNKAPKKLVLKVSKKKYRPITGDAVDEGRVYKKNKRSSRGEGQGEEEAVHNGRVDVAGAETGGMGGMLYDEEDDNPVIVFASSSS